MRGRYDAPYLWHWEMEVLGGLRPRPALLPFGVGACVLTRTEGQVWNPHSGPGTRPPPGLASTGPLNSTPPHRLGAQRLLAYYGPLHRRGMMTSSLFPVSGASLQPKPGELGVQAGPPWALRAETGVGSASGGSGPRTSPPRNPPMTCLCSPTGVGVGAA